MTKLLTYTMQSHNNYISFFPQYRKSLQSNAVFFVFVGIHSHRGDKLCEFTKCSLMITIVLTIIPDYQQPGPQEHYRGLMNQKLPHHI